MADASSRSSCEKSGEYGSLTFCIVSRPPMSAAATTVLPRSRRAGLERPPNQPFTRAIAAGTERGKPAAGVGSDTGSPELVERVQDLVTDRADQLHGDLRFLDRNHRAVQVV